MPEKPQLTEETVERIVAEETIRLEVREQLNKRKSDESSSRLVEIPQFRASAFSCSA